MRLVAKLLWTLVKTLPRPQQSRGYGLHRRLCVCLSVFAHDISKKTDTAKITKLVVEMFHTMSLGNPFI